MIGIVGGGISGLVLAYELDQRGMDVTLWEAASVPGGVMRSAVRGSLVLERGPQRARLSRPFRELVESLGLTDELITAPMDLPLYVYRRGRLRRAPLSLSSAVTTDLLPWSAKIRILAEPFVGGPKPDEQVGPFLRRKFGTEAYQALLGPLYGGLYASDPDRMPVKYALQKTLAELGVKRSILWRMLRSAGRAAASPPCSFRDGLGSLASALHQKLGGRAHLETSVRQVRRVAGGWDVFMNGERDAPPVRANTIVLACPADVAATLIEGGYPDQAERLSALRYNRLALAYLKSDARLRGLGYQVAFGESLETRGVTWNDSLFGRPGLYTAYLGGMKSPDLPDWGDSRIGALAAEEFETVTGHRAHVVEIAKTRIPAWDETWRALDALEWPQGLHVCSNYTARPGILGRIVDAKHLAVRLVASHATGS